MRSKPNLPYICRSAMKSKGQQAVMADKCQGDARPRKLTSKNRAGVRTVSCMS